MLQEAKLYKKLENNVVQCYLCAHNCIIPPKKYGMCSVRKNSNGVLRSLVYGDVIAAHVDPIEKKPLYHVLPKSRTYSIATPGCNFKCSFCQNWQISQVNNDGISIPGKAMSPDDVVKEAIHTGCDSIAYTYTEPTIFFEYAYDIAKKAKKEGLLNIFVTNGFMTREAIDLIRPYLDACNIDLKSFNDEFYRSLCHARLQPVLDSIRYMKEIGIWVELTTLIIPGVNDSDDELQAIAQFVHGIDPNMPWHISRFRPEYQYLQGEPTPVKTLKRARDIGKRQGLKYIYLGNVLEGNNTYCSQCEALLVERVVFSVARNDITNSLCSKCNASIPGIFQKKA